MKFVLKASTALATSLACAQFASLANAEPAVPSATPEPATVVASDASSQAQATPATDTAPAPAAQLASAPSDIVITAQRLDQARSGIQTQVGASTYTITSEAIAAQPGGENSLFNQVILQAPGVAQDSFGQLHVRGEHNGLQYRLNGIIIPKASPFSGRRSIRASPTRSSSSPAHSRRNTA